MKTILSILKGLLLMVGFLIIITIPYYLEDLGRAYREQQEQNTPDYWEDIYYNKIPDEDFDDILLRVPLEYIDDKEYIAKQWLKEQIE